MDTARPVALFIMKNIWLILLVIAVVLLVAAESKRDRKPGKKFGLGKGKGGNKRPNKNGKLFDNAYQILKLKI